MTDCLDKQANHHNKGRFESKNFYLFITQLWGRRDCQGALRLTWIFFKKSIPNRLLANLSWQNYTIFGDLTCPSFINNKLLQTASLVYAVFLSLSLSLSNLDSKSVCSVMGRENKRTPRKQKSPPLGLLASHPLYPHRIHLSFITLHSKISLNSLFFGWMNTNSTTTLQTPVWRTCCVNEETGLPLQCEAIVVSVALL